MIPTSQTTRGRAASAITQLCITESCSVCMRISMRIMSVFESVYPYVHIWIYDLCTRPHIYISSYPCIHERIARFGVTV